MPTVLNRSIGILAYIYFDYTKSEYILIPIILIFIPSPFFPHYLTIILRNTKMLICVWLNEITILNPPKNIKNKIDRLLIIYIKKSKIVTDN